MNKQPSSRRLTLNSYQCMMNRCYRPQSHGYENYGGRGITVCERWRNSFEAFVADMGYRKGGKREFTIERIDPNGNYEPGNCRWATYLEQARNTRFNIRITHNGRTQLLVEWAEELNVNRSLLRGRLKNKKNISIGDILGLSKAEWRSMDRKKYTFNGLTLNVEEWAKKVGVAYTTLIQRIRKWGIEKALSYGKRETTTPTYTFDGKTQPLSQWAKELGVKTSMLSKRLWMGMSVERAFSQNKRIAKKYTLNGKTQSLEMWAKEAGLSYHTLWRRIKSGMPLERALTSADINKARIERANRPISFNGKTMTTREWAKELGITHHQMMLRLKSGMTQERIFSPKRSALSAKRL